MFADISFNVGLQWLVVAYCGICLVTFRRWRMILTQIEKSSAERWKSTSVTLKSRSGIVETVAPISDEYRRYRRIPVDEKSNRLERNEWQCCGRRQLGCCGETPS